MKQIYCAVLTLAMMLTTPCVWASKSHQAHHHLITALQKRDLENVKLLAPTCAELMNTFNAHGCAPMHYAAQSKPDEGNGAIALIDTLLAYGADINQPTAPRLEDFCYSITPLMVAVMGGNIAAAVHLIRKGALITPKSSMGWTAFDMAWWRLHDSNMLRALLAAHRLHGTEDAKKFVTPTCFEKICDAIMQSSAAFIPDGVVFISYPPEYCVVLKAYNGTLSAAAAQKILDTVLPRARL